MDAAKDGPCYHTSPQMKVVRTWTCFGLSKSVNRLVHQRMLSAPSLQAREGRTKQSADHPAVSTPPAARGPESDFWLDYDDYEHDDDEIEDYYFSSAAGGSALHDTSSEHIPEFLGN